MKTTSKIAADLQETGITWKVALLFLPIAFLTFLFHEFGHWTFGEVLGNEMTLSLNNSTPKSGHFIEESHRLWSSIGGPLFTIFQALAGLVITRATRSVYAYSIVFFAVFSRFFSILFGGINAQDEATVASLLNTDKYLIAGIVLAILGFIQWKSNRAMKQGMKALGYFTVLGVFAMLIVIAVAKL